MQRLRTLHLFAGAGGGILADLLLGHQPICAVEINEYCQQVLSARQKDGCLPWFPIFGDVKEFDGKPWRGLVDVVSGGFPCQDISAAGNGAGIDGERSGLWREMARIIGEVLPRFVFVENSPLLVGRGLAVVLGDLAELGYDAEWCRLSASNLGAPHQRDRAWLVAYPSGQHEQGQQSERTNQEEWKGSQQRPARPCGYGLGWWASEPGMGRVADVLANRVDRLKAIGNGQVSAVAATAFSILRK